MPRAQRGVVTFQIAFEGFLLLKAFAGEILFRKRTPPETEPASLINVLQSRCVAAGLTDDGTRASQPEFAC